MSRQMSALGHKRTFAPQKVMSALTLKADVCDAKTNVRFVPKADIVEPYSITSSARARICPLNAKTVVMHPSARAGNRLALI